MGVRGVSSLALASLVALSGCTAILGDFSLGGEDAGSPGTDASSDGAGPTASDAAVAADASNGADAKAPATEAGEDATLAPDGPAGDTGAANPDATMADAEPGDAGPDTSTGDARADGSGPHDAAADGTAGEDAGCAAGLTACSAGCVNLQSSAANCGACGHACNGGSCAAAACGGYVIAQQPTTGMVAKVATDGQRVVWSDTGIVAIKQIAATGGTAITLATASTTYGGVGPDLAFAKTAVAFTYTSEPSVGLATVDVADSGVFAFAGAVAVGAVSLNSLGTHVFFVNTTGTQSDLNDCMFSGVVAGTCTGVGDTGRFLAQTAADGTYLFYDLTSAETQPGLYIDVIASHSASIFSPAAAASLAVDGTWAYWTVANDGGTTYTIDRTLEATPDQVQATQATHLAASPFATDGVNLYYWNGTSIVSRPVGGGPETVLAAATSLVQIAVGGGLLVWTDGATISGIVLP
jgi:hypothetical protein